jgi:hypothetical protein
VATVRAAQASEAIDEVVFCAFSEEDLGLYQRLLAKDGA